MCDSLIAKRNQLWTIVIVLLSAAAAIVVYYTAVQRIDADNFALFRQAVDEQAGDIKRDLSDSFHMIYDIARLFDSVENVTAQNFYGFIKKEDFKDHPSFYNIGWAPRVIYSKKAEFELTARREGILPDYFIFEREGGKDVAVRARDEYFPFHYRRQDNEGDIRIKGFDIASSPMRRKALEKARDTGDMAATEPIRLITEPSGDVKSLQIYMPVYYGNPKTVQDRRTNLRGFTFGTFRVKNIFEKSFIAHGDLNKHTVYDIKLQGLPGDEGLLYRHTPPGVDNLSKLNYIRTIEAVGQTIEIKAVPDVKYIAERRGRQPYYYGAAVFIIICLFGVFVVSAGTYTAQMKTEVASKTAKLRESEKKYRQLIELSQEGIWLIDQNALTTYVNHAMADMLGYTVEEIMGRNFLDFMDENMRSIAISAIENHIKKEGSARLEFSLLHKDGSTIHVFVSASALLDEQGHYIGCFAAVLNITERKELEQILLESEKEYRQLVELSQEGIWAVDKDNLTTFVNQAMADMLGYMDDEMKGVLFLEFLDDTSRLKAINSLKHQVQSGEKDRIELVFLHKSGKAVNASASVASITDGKGGYAGSVAVISDITKRMELDAQLRKSLAEKELLLKEVHHRVKNNLQIISGMLGMQMEYVSDQNYHNMFEDCQRRIQSIALIHERLYRSEGLTNIDMRDYVAQLVEGYSKNLILDDTIAIKTDIDHISVGIDIAIPCGLIMNELLTNALKHAFPIGNPCITNKTCEVTVAIHSLDDNIGMVVQTENWSMTELPGWMPPYSAALEIVVSDNGVGFPEGKDFRKSKGLGMQIVLILVRQLGATIELDGTHGTKFSIKFQNSIKEQ
ncbi:MAG: PAS domain S-box protein [Nitrospirae bacterium]|nr:PAS domain S-box protein [Nitrospirota bacterium]